MTITITPRTGWGARPPRSISRIRTPSPELWLHHTAGSHRGGAGMRQIQDFHMDVKRWPDIAYTNVIDRVSLEVFEATGPGVEGTHTHGHNDTGHAICVMGNFETLHGANDELIARIAELVRHGHGKGWWPNQITGGHRDVRSTACPGRNLYARIDDINRLALQEQPMGTPLVTEIQQVLVDAGIDIGDFGPDGNGIDGILGRHTVGGVHTLKNQRNSARTELEVANTNVTELQASLELVQQQLEEALADSANHDAETLRKAAVGELAIAFHTLVREATS